MDIEIASARSLTNTKQAVYELQVNDRVYQRVTDNLLGILVPLWTAQPGVLPPNGLITEAQIRETRMGFSRFYPGPQYEFNSTTDWHELSPFKVPLLRGFKVADGASTAGLTPDPVIAAAGEVLYQWITARLHQSEGTLMQLALYAKAVSMQTDSAAINTLVKRAFGET